MAQLPQTGFLRVIIGVAVLQFLLNLSETRIAEIIQDDDGVPYHTWNVTQWLEHLNLEIVNENADCEHAKRVYREGFLVANITTTLLRQRMLEQNHWREEQRSQLKACLARELEMRYLFQQCYQPNATTMNFLATVDLTVKEMQLKLTETWKFANELKILGNKQFEELKKLYQKETLDLQNRNDELQYIILSKDQICMDLFNIQCNTTCREITSTRETRNLKTVETAIMYGNLINKLTKCVGANHIHVLTLLEEKAPVIKELGQSLITESRSGNVEKVRNLINAGVSVSVNNSDGWTPLLIATNHNKANIVKLLLQSGADPNIKNKWGDTNLVWAAHHDNVEVAKMLREKGASLDFQSGQTALHFAAHRGGVNIIRYFLSIGANINAKDDSGMTPLKYAIQANKTVIAEFLRSQGAKE